MWTISLGKCGCYDRSQVLEATCPERQDFWSLLLFRTEELWVWKKIHSYKAHRFSVPVTVLEHILWQRRGNEEPQRKIDKIPFLPGQSCMWKVSVQNRILGKNATLPGEKQVPSRAGKVPNVFLSACSRNILVGHGNKAGNCFFACHPGAHMVVSKLEEDGQTSDRRGWGAPGAQVPAISLARTILWLSPCVLSGYPWGWRWLAAACTHCSGSSNLFLAAVLPKHAHTSLRGCAMPEQSLHCSQGAPHWQSVHCTPSLCACNKTIFLQ